MSEDSATSNVGATQVEVDTTLRYKGDISENLSMALWPAVKELGVEGERNSLELTDNVRVTGTLEVEIVDE